ncbi:MAG: prolyl-tRNA synthetase associated domain-containing protein [Firmicutes bacterium]|nr:prolyl-tRNA synthetase associated domain-containing protein [Bacillota bacterium]
MLNDEIKVYEMLDELNIPYKKYHHPPYSSTKEANKYIEKIKGVHCKNLFLRSGNGNNHYLLITESTKEVNLKKLAKYLKENRIKFASVKVLMKYLGIESIAITPFRLMNDTKSEVKVLIDTDLRYFENINFQPNISTSTVTISFMDFERYLDWCGNKVKYIKI